MASGTVNRLWRWPVKSMAGEEVRALSLDGRGVGGDRSHAVFHEHKGEWKAMTAREAPWLLSWKAVYPFNLDAGLNPHRPPHAIVTRPDGRRTWVWGDPHLRWALQAAAGEPIRLERDVEGMQDLGRSVLVTTEASLRALSEELGVEIDVRRFRTNLHLELDAPAFAEEEWEGRELAFAGGVRLQLLHPCVRCVIPTRDPETQEKWAGLLRHLHARHRQRFGINARVLGTGRIAEGERVELM
jgi:uncharacterized protein YcbX